MCDGSSSSAGSPGSIAQLKDHMTLGPGDHRMAFDHHLHPFYPADHVLGHSAVAESESSKCAGDETANKVTPDSAVPDAKASQAVLWLRHCATSSSEAPCALRGLYAE